MVHYIFEDDNNRRGNPTGITYGNVQQSGRPSRISYGDVQQSGNPSRISYGDVQNSGTPSNIGIGGDQNRGNPSRIGVGGDQNRGGPSRVDTDTDMTGTPSDVSVGDGRPSGISVGDDEQVDPNTQVNMDDIRGRITTNPNLPDMDDVRGRITTNPNLPDMDDVRDIYHPDNSNNGDNNRRNTWDDVEDNPYNFDHCYDNTSSGITGLAINYEKPENYNLISGFDDSDKTFN